VKEANTKDCFRDLIGRRIIGVLFDALPSGGTGVRVGNKTLILDDGTGFTFHSSGSFWQETKEAIDRAIDRQIGELRAAQRDIEEVLAVAGAWERSVLETVV
jgi:hypothetical protein